MTSCFSRLFFILVFFSATVFAQKTNLFWQPELNLSYNPENRWSYNFEINNRNILSEDGGGFKVRHLDISHFTTYEIGFYGKISLGIKYRERDWFDTSRSDEYRLTQQYGYAQRYNNLRIGYRARMEERFYTDETVFRMRHRIAADIPFQGLTLNTGEFYGLATTESLYSIGAEMKPELDQRFTLSLGNQIGDRMKIQISAEYRLEDYLNRSPNQFFMITSAFIDL